MLGYFDAPPNEPKVHELVTWLNHNEIIGFNAASLAPVANYSRPGRAMAFTGPGIACDWLEIEGPLHEVWPPKSHRVLFGDLPIVEFRSSDHPNVRPPRRTQVRQLARASTGPIPSRASGRSLAISHWSTPTACSRASCPERSAGPSPTTSGATTSRGSKSG